MTEKLTMKDVPLRSMRKVHTSNSLRSTCTATIQSAYSSLRQAEDCNGFSALSDLVTVVIEQIKKGFERCFCKELGHPEATA